MTDPATREWMKLSERQICERKFVTAHETALRVAERAASGYGGKEVPRVDLMYPGLFTDFHGVCVLAHVGIGETFRAAENVLVDILSAGFELRHTNHVTGDYMNKRVWRFACRAEFPWPTYKPGVQAKYPVQILVQAILQSGALCAKIPTDVRVDQSYRLVCPGDPDYETAMSGAAA